MPVPVSEYVWGLHNNGIHTRCGLADLWTKTKRIGDGTPRKCEYAGKVERFHSHDFDGPLDCGCDDDAL
jgi:hypothetical protein